VNDYGNDGGVEREEKQKPFPSLPTPPWKLAKTASFPHSHSLGDDLGFPFSPSSFNFNIDESVTYMPGTFCYRHPRSHNKAKAKHRCTGRPYLTIAKYLIWTGASWVCSLAISGG
jgi:hypothetical protein